jgi:hypothetical protein
MDQFAYARHMRHPKPPRKPRRWNIKPTEDFRQRKGKSEDVLEDWTLINTLPSH